MTLSVKDAANATQTIKTNDDLVGVAGTPNANVLTFQGAPGGAAMTVSGTVAVSNLATTQPVSGSVAVSNFPASQPVSATALPLPAGAATAALQAVINADGGSQTHIMNLPATQPISGTVTVANPTAAGITDTQLRASAVPVAVTFPATQPISGAVSVSNLPTTQAVSAAALPLPTGAATAASQPSNVTTSLGTAGRVVLVDPITGNGSLVQAFHNADNQVVGATSYGLLTGGVDQLINGAGNLDRKRAVSGDAMTAVGLASEVPMLWNGTSYDRAVNAGGTSAKAARVVIATDQTAIPEYRVGTTYTDRSGTVTAGGTAQVLAATNANRRGFRIMNLSTGDLWVNDKGATAAIGQPAFKIVSGALYESPHFGASTAAISIFGATTAQAFEAMEA